MSRPGIPAAGALSAHERAIGVGSLLDLVARITGGADGIAKLKALGTLAETTLTATLGGGATLADTITKVNELQAAIAVIAENQIAIQVKVDQIIKRLQED